MKTKDITIEETLEKEGITNIKELDTLKVNSISKLVAQKLCDAFPDYGLDYKTLFIEIARLNMYSATMPDTLAQAKYYYKNSAIYFNETADLNNLDAFAIHECIHYLQSVKDNDGKLCRLGLCNFSKAKQPGIALNEAAVQLITTKCDNAKSDTVKYYGIELPTTSPTYYPLECCLVNQMAQVTGLGTLFESTLHSNNNFKNKFIELTSVSAYETIELNIDYLMELEDTLSSWSAKLVSDVSDKEIDKINSKIAKTKEKIVTVFMGVQKLIYTSYFNKYFKVLKEKKDVENFKKSLSTFQKLVGTNETHKDFDEFYSNIVAKVDKKFAGVLDDSTSLTTVKTNFISTIFRKIKALITGNETTVEKYTGNN